MKASHVILIGVDGAGNFFRQANTPHLDRIFAQGAVSYDVLTSNPTISGQCWGSMLTGVTPEVHGLTNGIVSTLPYPKDSPFPSVFRVIREAMPDAELAAFSNWNPINTGIIEEGLGVEKGTGNDAQVTDMACAYVADHDPAFVFIQFDEVDGAGHREGYGTEGHLKQIETSDALIGRIREAYEARGWLDDTLFIVTADHGGFGHSHGGWTDGEKYIMFAAAGPGVTHGTVGEMGVRDCAAVVLYALGLADRQPATWTARVPSGLFEGVEAKDRPAFDIPYALSHRTRKPGATPVGNDSLSAVLGRERVAVYLPFDGDCSDETGKVKTETGGKLYYIDGVNGKGIRVDDGFVSLPWSAEDHSFSAAFWIKADGLAFDPVIFADKPRNEAQKTGIVLSLNGGALHFNAGDGEKDSWSVLRLPLDCAGGWMHVALAVDREKGEIRTSFDFAPFQVRPLAEESAGKSFGGEGTLFIGCDTRGKGVTVPLPAVLDDFILLNDALTDGDLEKLKTFWGI